MNYKINKSIDFLIKEFNRLKILNNKKKISKEQLMTLKKLALFLGKKIDV